MSLKEEEKEQLLERIQAGDEEARETYIKGNLRLVLSVIRRFESSSENADDLFQIGCVGLMKAVDHFDPSRMVKFSTYAVPMIIGEIRRYLRDNSPIDEIGIAKEDVVFAMDAIQSPMSLQEPVYSDGGDTLYVMDQVSDKKNKEDNWVEELSLEAAMERLNERERRIIRLRFFEGRTQMEVADQIRISQAQVSRLEKNALRTMRKYLLGE